MKNLILTSLILTFSSITYAGEPKAALCRDVAIEAAKDLFAAESPVEVDPSADKGEVLEVDTTLIDMNHGWSEVSYEVWDISISEGQNHALYRIHLMIDDDYECTATGFEFL